MRRITRAKPSASIIIAVVALVAALGSGAVAGVTISKLNKREKEQVKRIAERKAKRLDKKIELLPGPAGERGPQGLKGDPGAPGPENATTANGIRPVKVDYAAEPGPAETEFLNEGGIQIKGQCLNEAMHTRLQFEPTATDGVFNSIAENEDSTKRETVERRDFEGTSPTSVITNNFPDRLWRVAFDYRGATGTTVTGSLQVVEGADAAHCVISGTLLVG